METAEHPFPPEDCLLVDERDDRLRLGVIDGASNTLYRRDYAGVSAGTWASGVVATCLRSSASLEHCLGWANRVLFDRGAAPGRGQMSASVVALDIFSDGSVRTVRAGDCWMAPRKGKKWEKGLWGEPRSKESLDLFYAQTSFESKDKAKQFKVEQEVFASPDVWSSAPMGYFPSPKIECLSLPQNVWSALALGSDGTQPSSASELGEIEKDPLKFFRADGDQTLLLLSKD